MPSWTYRTAARRWIACFASFGQVPSLKGRGTASSRFPDGSAAERSPMAESQRWCLIFVACGATGSGAFQADTVCSIRAERAESPGKFNDAEKILVDAGLSVVSLPSACACSPMSFAVLVAFRQLTALSCMFQDHSARGGMTCGIELRGNLPRFQTASGGLPPHILQPYVGCGESAFDQFGKRAHTAFLLRRGNRQELFDRILLFGFHRRRETPNKRFAQRISLRHAGRIGSGSNEGLDLGDRQRGRRLLLTLLLGFGANLLCLQNGSFKRFIDLDGRICRHPKQRRARRFHSHDRRRASSSAFSGTTHHFPLDFSINSIVPHVSDFTSISIRVS